MNTIRENAIAAVAAMPPVLEEDIRPVEDITGAFGSDVFSIGTMQTVLPRQVFETLMKTIRDGVKH